MATSKRTKPACALWFRGWTSTTRQKHPHPHLHTLRRTFSQSSGNRTPHPKTAIFFPGQGTQRVGMASEFLKAFPRTVKPMLDQIDETLQTPLSRLIAEGPNSALTATENAQPAIMATSIMILRVLEREFGLRLEERVDFALGHSLGEFAALVAAGYLREKDALILVRRRAEIMAQCGRQASDEYRGDVGMVALVCEGDQRDAMVDAIHGFLGHSSPGFKADSGADSDAPSVRQVLIANINSKNQIVLSGSIERIKTLLTHISQFGGHDPRAVRLNCDSPFHSPLMTPAALAMKKMLHAPSYTSPDADMITFPTTLPCISNVSARPFYSRAELKDLLARQCVETVQWHDSIQYLHRHERVTRWIGIGPGKVGRNLVGKEVGIQGKSRVKGGGVWAVTDPREAEEVMRALDDTEMMDAGGEEEEEEEEAEGRGQLHAWKNI